MRGPFRRRAISGAFRYGADPLCLIGCGLYAMNRWLLKPHLSSAFLHGQFNDLLFIPCALPLLLWIQRRLGLRTHDGFPEPGEILLHLVVWTLIVEGIGPFWLHHGTADGRDVAAYFIGALAAGVVWTKCSRAEDRKNPQKTM